MLSKLRERGAVEAEHVKPVSFPVRYVVSENRAGELIVLCYLIGSDYSFAFWSESAGLCASHFEPYHSLQKNSCLDEIRKFCEEIHAAWSEGKSRDAGLRTDPPANTGADETPSAEGS